jgi:hypothetical protein
MNLVLRVAVAASLVLIAGCTPKQPAQDAAAGGKREATLEDIVAKRLGPGTWKLVPPYEIWIKATIRTGYFATEAHRKSDMYQADGTHTFTHGGMHKGDEMARMPSGAVWIAESAGSGLTKVHTLAELLPDDETLRACTQVSELVKILGPRQLPTDGWGSPEGMHSSAGWRAFSLKNGVLETLAVFALTIKTSTDKDARIEGLEVRRGSSNNHRSSAPSS